MTQKLEEQLGTKKISQQPQLEAAAANQSVRYDDVLYQVPEHVQAILSEMKGAPIREETAANVTTLTEVLLPIDVKLHNIQRTQEILEQHKSGSSLVAQHPSMIAGNVSTNFAELRRDAVRKQPDDSRSHDRQTLDKFRQQNARRL